jgi:hypothetical protein
MNKLNRVFVPSILLTAIFAVPSFAIFAMDDEALRKDLTAVIALQGLPCVQVVTVKTQAESDYAVTCKDANKYRVYLNDKGRVVVEKSK